MFDPELEEILRQEGSCLELIQPGQEPGAKLRIRCNLTGHELPVSATAVRKYIQSSAKYQRLRALQRIVEENPNGAFLEDQGNTFYCKLTNRVLSKNNPKEVENHFNRKRFKKALQKHQEEEEAESMEEAGPSESEDGEEGAEERMEDGNEMDERFGDLISDSEEKEAEEESPPPRPSKRKHEAAKKDGAKTQKKRSKK